VLRKKAYRASNRKGQATKAKHAEANEAARLEAYNKSPEGLINQIYQTFKAKPHPSI